MEVVEKLVAALRKEADWAAAAPMIEKNTLWAEGMRLIGLKFQAAADTLESQERTIAMLTHERDSALSLYRDLKPKYDMMRKELQDLMAAIQGGKL